MKQLSRVLVLIAVLLSTGCNSVANAMWPEKFSVGVFVDPRSGVDSDDRVPRVVFGLAWGIPQPFAKTDLDD